MHWVDGGWSVCGCGGAELRLRVMVELEISEKKLGGPKSLKIGQSYFATGKWRQ